MITRGYTQEETFLMKGYDIFLSALFKKIDIIISISYSFCIGVSVSNNSENIKEKKKITIISKYSLKNQMICNDIQKVILLRKDELETAINFFCNSCL